MKIKNETVLSKGMVEGAMRASNFDNNKYKTLKVIYNFMGLIFGMMMIRYLVFEIIGNPKSDRVLLWFYIFMTLIFLYIGMIGMDKSSKKKFQMVYKKMIGIKFTYDVTEENIVMTDPDGDSEEFGWDRIIKWNQDNDNFYLFVSENECLIMNKKGYIEGNEKDFRELLKTMIKLRKEKEDEKMLDNIKENENNDK